MILYDHVVASPSTEWSYGWNYKGIFNRITDKESKIISSDHHPITGEKKKVFSSSSLLPLDLGRMIIEEHYDWTYLETDDQVLALYDTERIGELKNKIDEISVMLKDNSSDFFEIRGSNFIEQNNALLYFDSSYEEEWIDYCYFDIYDFCDRIIISSKFSSEINNLANEIKKTCEDVIVYSFGGSYFERFKNNKTGISLFIPDGNKNYNGQPMWSYQKWYNAKDCLIGGGDLSFCRDGAVENNRVVENYFEVLDYWFDIEDGNGGYNEYSY